jgi:hypothetical protein
VSPWTSDGDVTKRDEINPFVQLLWERGSLFEQKTLSKLQIPFADLSGVNEADRERLTLEAMSKGESLIYGGCIKAGDLLGRPDLLRKEVGGYIPGDIKSGRGHDGRPKRHYAVQLGLYVDILERLNRSAGRRAFVLDIHGARSRTSSAILLAQIFGPVMKMRLLKRGRYSRCKSFRFPVTPAYASFVTSTVSALKSSRLPTI